MLNHSLVPVGSTGYDIDNSLRFNDDDSAYLSRTFVLSNRRTFTYSCWFKRGFIGTAGMVLFGNTQDIMMRIKDDRLQVYNWKTSEGLDYGWIAQPLIRDPSAWYHVVFTVDTTNATAVDRMRIYLNGERLTDKFTDYGDPPLNWETDFNTAVPHQISEPDATQYYDGYLAEVNFVDGQALTPSDFGETDETYGHWKPIEYAGTYGTNGFYLDFKDASNLGSDNKSTLNIFGDGSCTALYKLDNNTNDESGNYNGTATSITYTSDGKYDSAAVFNGSSSKVEVGGMDSTQNNFTFATWVKVNSYSSRATIISDKTNATVNFYIDETTNKLTLYANESSNSDATATSSSTIPTGVWTHVAGVCSSAGIKLYINGVEDGSATHDGTAYSTKQTSALIGGWGTGTSTRYLNGTLDQFRVFNRALTASEVLSLGSPNLGNDANGSNNWTPNNLAATDQMLDSPTNNFATLNPLDHDALTFSEGNLTVTSTANDRAHETRGTLSLTGKHYWEVVRQDTPGETGATMGVCSTDIEFTTNDVYIGYYPNTSGIYGDGKHRNGSSTIVATYATQSAGSIMMFAYDADTGKFWIGKDGTWFNSGVPASGTGHVSVVPNYATKTYSPAVTAHNNVKVVANFGQDSSFAGNKTSQGNADGNGYGDFYYTPPTGFLALCTQNLPEPTVVPSEHFNTVLYTGNDTARDITGFGFNPDLIWIKTRSTVNNNILHDRVRGAGAELVVNDTASESDKTTRLDEFVTDGFGLVGGGSGYNGTGVTYVTWGWRADNTAGVSNTDGSITSTVSANVDAGFSIVSYTGTGSAATVGHGLSQAPEAIIVKRRSSAESWFCHWESLGTGGFIKLDQTGASGTNATAFPWNPTATTFGLSNDGATNQSSETYINYNFHSVEGYSKVGSYTGNDSTDGTFVHCGFRPAYVMFKCSSNPSEWKIIDDARNPHNVMDLELRADSSQAESQYSGHYMDFLSNGVKFRATDHPNQAKTYIFIAFAEHPFKYTNAR